MKDYYKSLMGATEEKIKTLNAWADYYKKCMELFNNEDDRDLYNGCKRELKSIEQELKTLLS